MCLTMGLYDPDLSLISLPMQTFPRLLKLSYPPSKHIPGKDAIYTQVCTCICIYLYGDKKSGSRIAAMLHENPMYGQLVAASAYNDFA